MKKGCIITLVAFLVVIIAGSTWFFRSWTPKLQQSRTVRLIRDVESAVAKYEELHGKLGEEQRADFLEIVRGNNPVEKDYFEGSIDGFVDEDGEVVDVWRRPMKLELDRQGAVRFISAGLNGQFGDGDDITADGTKAPKLPKPSG